MKNYEVGDRVKIVDSTLEFTAEAANLIGREGIIKKIFKYNDLQTDYDVAIIGEADELPGYNHSDLELVV